MVPIQSSSKAAKDQNHPFQRGIMTFDDYNYSQYNDYVLITDPQNPL